MDHGLKLFIGKGLSDVSGHFPQVLHLLMADHQCTHSNQEIVLCAFEFSIESVIN